MQTVEPGVERERINTLEIELVQFITYGESILTEEEKGENRHEGNLP